MANVTQQCVGTCLFFYPLRILQGSGRSDEYALFMRFVLRLSHLSAMNSQHAMRFLGRRTLWLAGLVVELACLAALGGLATPHAPWVVAPILISLLMAVHSFTIGPLCGVIVAEVPATRLKVATNSVARGAYTLVGLGNTLLVPRLLERGPGGWDLGPQAAFVWIGPAAACLVWAWFRRPETKGRTPLDNILSDVKVAVGQWCKSVEQFRTFRKFVCRTDRRVHRKRQ
ncbi:hypothetical protein E4U41_001538 [Claviceps citrina]|nr:hypothetical protein E4U41_001538 [Claviceps citrina]